MPSERQWAGEEEERGKKEENWAGAPQSWPILRRALAANAFEYLLQIDNASAARTVDGGVSSPRQAKSCGGKVANLHYASVEELV